VVVLLKWLHLELPVGRLNAKRIFIDIIQGLTYETPFFIAHGKIDVFCLIGIGIAFTPLSRCSFFIPPAFMKDEVAIFPWRFRVFNEW